MKYQNYLFDLDGTLIDTTEMIYMCVLNTLRVFGKERKPREEIVSYIGIPLRDQMDLLFGKLSDKKYEEIIEVHMGHQWEIYKDYLKLFPGVLETLETLKSNNKNLAVITSRKLLSAKRFAEEFGIYKYFDVFVTPDDTLKHKPDKAPVVEAVRQLGNDERSIFIGDAIFDIQSGNSAGVDTVFVKWSHTDSKTLETKPTFVIGKMEDLLSLS